MNIEDKELSELLEGVEIEKDNLSEEEKAIEWVNKNKDIFPFNALLNYISRLQKELDKKDKVINLIIDDFQAENYFINMTNKEVREYYSKRKELK